MNTNDLSAIGEARIEYEAVKRGYGVAIPKANCKAYDLIVDRDGCLERVQVKTTQSNGKRITVAGYSMSKHKNGKKKAVNYKSTDFEWLAIHDVTTDQCYFIPSDEIRARLYLRIEPSKNNQTKGIRWAKDYISW